MDEDSDEEENRAKKTSQRAGAKENQPTPKKDLPLPPNPEQVIIRKDYDPKVAKQQAQSGSSTKSQPGEMFFKSPLTGELIPASSMSEHMRISMLDPRWIEQKQKERKEREEQEEVLASGMSIEKNLKRLAEYRSDVFGSGAEEVLIGRKVGDEEKRREAEAAAIWEDNSATPNAAGDKTAKRPSMGISVEDQIKVIQGEDDASANAAASKIGPTIPKIPGQVR